MKYQAIDEYQCPNCQQKVHLNGACCPMCGMSADADQSDVAMLGNIPFTYLVALVSIFCVCMMVYLPR